jgi:diaminopimelate epimerase
MGWNEKKSIPRGRNDSVCFVKYHALGNDYLFLDFSEAPLPGRNSIEKICHRNFGVGADGVLFGGRAADRTFSLRVINPDGSEAETSGNGLRIFSRAMLDAGHVSLGQQFFVGAGKRIFGCCVLAEDRIRVDMGVPSFEDGNIPNFRNGTGDGSGTFAVNGQEFRYYPVSMGNPHCVVFVDKLPFLELESVGPLLENNPLFPQKTNVQFVSIRNEGNIAVEIWERGVGHTLASGSSACAAFAVCRQLGRCSSKVTVLMAGGTLGVESSPNGGVIQTGPVEKIAKCWVENSFLRSQLDEALDIQQSYITNCL